MKLKDEEHFWDLYRYTGDYFAIDMKEDATEKYGDFLEGEIFAIMRESEGVENFRYGWLIRKVNGLPYMICFVEQLEYMVILIAKVELLTP